MELPRYRLRAAGRVAAAVTTWGVVFSLTQLALREAAVPLRDLSAPAAVLQIVYLTAMLVAIWQRTRRPRIAAAAFATQLASALAVGWLVPIGWLPIFTIVWLAMVPSFFRARRTAFLLLVALTVAWYVIQRRSWQEAEALRQALLWGVFHLFAVFSALETRGARQARDEIATLNRELLATRRLLEEASRSAERTRIARDLHDLLGHHLTALSINLQVASRQAEGDVRERVEHCHALARLLLSDLREAVSELREDAGIDVAAALAALTADTPGLEVHLDVPDDLQVRDVETARTILRCVQESLTNTLRHAGASRCWITLAETAGRLTVDFHDDGQVRGELQPGNGLTGLRERVRALDGELRLTRQDHALAVRVSLPLVAEP